MRVGIKKIIMNPRDHGEAIERQREGIRQRAIWLYYFLAEAKNRGWDWEDFGRKVMFNCGVFKGEQFYPDTDSVAEFAKVYQSPTALKLFDSEILVSSATALIVESHYCPLLEAWLLLSDDRDFIKKLCEIAMEGDRGVISRYCDFNFKVCTTLGAGDAKCRVEIWRNKNKG
jgi:hypothetical protein